VSARTSWRSRRIDGRALARLDVLGQGRLVLQLPPWATVTRGQVRPLEADLLARRYQLTGDADVDWRIPASALARSLLLLALFLLVVLVGVLLPAARAVAPSYRRLRGVTATRASRVGNLRIGLALLLPALLLVAVNLTTAFGRAPAVSLVALLLSWLLLLAGAPLLAVRLMPTRPLEEPTRGRLEELLRRGGVRVRGIRVLDTRAQKVANALILGPLPRLRYIVVTDHLLQSLEPDEVDAIVAHEMGHARQHHLLVKLGVLLAVAAALVGALILGGRLLVGADAVVLVLAGPLLLLVSVLLVQGGLGLLLERQADEYAARLVGADAVVRALDRLAETNMLKRRTGVLWNLATHHPGIEQRVDRLRRRQAGELTPG
jgi:STE24 endopeptidase